MGLGFNPRLDERHSSLGQSSEHTCPSSPSGILFNGYQHLAVREQPIPVQNNIFASMTKSVTLVNGYKESFFFIQYTGRFGAHIIS